MSGETKAGLTLIERPPAVEAALWRRLRFEDEQRCRETLFNLHLPLAHTIARFEFRRRPAYGLEKQDFAQLAIGGLLDAIDRFDPLHGAPFSAFARPRIRGAIADGLARSSERSAQYSFRRRLERERLRSLASETASTDAIVELSDVAMGLAIGLIAEHSGSVFAAAALHRYESDEWRDIEQAVARAIAELPQTEQTIMIQHYTHGIAFAEIASLLGVSKSRVSQLHRSAIQRIRKRIAGPQ